MSLWPVLVVVSMAAGALSVLTPGGDGAPVATPPATDSSTASAATASDLSSPEPSPAEPSPAEPSPEPSEPPAPTVQLISVATGECIDSYPQYVTAYVHVVDCDTDDGTLQLVGRVRLRTLRIDREVLQEDGTLTAVQAAYAKQCVAAFPQLADDVDGGVTPVAPIPVEWATVPHEVICLDAYY